MEEEVKTKKTIDDDDDVGETIKNNPTGKKIYIQ